VVAEQQQDEYCLERILCDTARAYLKTLEDDILQQQLSQLDRDPRVDMSLVMGMCLLRAAGCYDHIRRGSKLREVDTSCFLQAVAILDSQLHKTPDEIPLRLLLVQLYLLMGCASLAHQLWTPLGVKRTIQDALSPLFFDRISSISPGIFLGRKPLTEPLNSYYTNTLQEPSPVKIWDAFQAGSYTSILNMSEFNDRLRRSCTRIMGVVEERRAVRSLGGKLEDLTYATVICSYSIPLTDSSMLILSLADVKDDTSLINVTDFGSWPDFESSSSQPLHDVLGLGPALSVRNTARYNIRQWTHTMVPLEFPISPRSPSREIP